MNDCNGLRPFFFFFSCFCSNGLGVQKRYIRLARRRRCDFHILFLVSLILTINFAKNCDAFFSRIYAEKRKIADHQRVNWMHCLAIISILRATLLINFLSCKPFSTNDICPDSSRCIDPSY